MTRRRSGDLPPDRAGITDPADWNRLEAALQDGVGDVDFKRFEFAKWAQHTSRFVLLAYELRESRDEDPSTLTPGTRAWLCSEITHVTAGAEKCLLHAVNFKDADAAEDALVHAFDAGRLSERLLFKLGIEDHALRGIRTDPAKATQALVDRATSDNARLERRFEEIREELGTRDEDGDLEQFCPKGRAYAAVAAEVMSGKLALKGTRKPTTATAVRIRISRRVVTTGRRPRRR